MSDSWNDPVALEALWSRRKKVSVQLKTAAIASAPMPFSVSLSRDKIVLETLPVKLARAPIALFREPLELTSCPVELINAPVQVMEAPLALMKERVRVAPPVALNRVPVSVLEPVELISVS